MRLLFCLVLIFYFFKANSKQAGDTIPRLFDSITQTLFDDYNTSMNRLSELEAVIAQRGVEQYVSEAINIQILKANLNRYYFHPRVCRQSLTEASRLLELHKKQLGEKYQVSLAAINSEWAGFYFDVNDYESAFDLYVQSLEGYKKLPQTAENCMSLFIVSQYMARIQEIRGESEAAINQYLTSIDYYKCSKGLNYTFVFRNVGSAYLTTGNLSKARYYFHLAEDSLQSAWKGVTPKSDLATAGLSLYEVISQFHSQNNSYDSAFLTLKKADKFLAYSMPALRARYQLSLGHAFENLNDLAQSQKNYEASISLLQNKNDNMQLAEAYMSLGHLLEKKENFGKALLNYQNAIAALVLNFDPLSMDNPKLTNILSKKSLFQVLHHKYALLEKLSEQLNDPSVLQRAWATNQLALALIDSTSNEVSLDKDKVILAGQSFHAYEDGIRLANKLFRLTHDDRYFQECFSMIDKSKGILLLENLRLVNNFAGVDKQWLEKERDLKSELLFLEQEIFRLTNPSKDQAQLLSLREEYARSKRDYALLIDSMKKSAPSYHQLRFNHQVISIHDIQHQLLQPNEAMIEFFVGDKSVTVAGFSTTSQYMKVKDLLPDLTNKITRFRTLLMASDSLRIGKEFRSLSTELYNYLLRDCLSSLGNIKQLTIIPDGILGYVPFEVLETNQAEEISYLVDKYSIRYAYSASYLHEQSKKRLNETSNFFAGFLSAGDKDGSGLVKRNGLSTLKYARKEMESITELLGSHYKVFEDATKTDFINNAHDSRVLHLAMHAQVNDENPMFSKLMFESEKDTLKQQELFAIELYDMQLSSDLAVLSACETGVGQLHRGEGIMSFSRAFAYAGVPASVISLWKVPDKATSLLMVNFYAYLKEGLQKDIALQKAKQDFMKAYPQMSHPYYWSGFILMGNNTCLPFPTSFVWMWWTGVVMLITALAWLVWKRKNYKQLTK